MPSVDNADEGIRQKLPWDEVIPGIDEATKRMYEEWDEVYDGLKDEPIVTLFDPPLAMKAPEEIADENEANEWLRTLLMRLAQLCVAIDICPHFTALDTYRWLMNDILLDAAVHPDLKKTGIIQHYSTYESCERCAAEFDAEYEKRHGKPS